MAQPGFAATSVSQITDAADANLGAINYHFRSKDALYAVVFARRAALVNVWLAEQANLVTLYEVLGGGV